jgi:hypothetical protein
LLFRLVNTHEYSTSAGQIGRVFVRRTRDEPERTRYGVIIGLK